ncbi:MAG: GNAT family N-acetyltransferase [Myxococcales bacterium]|nr:GNAT family N-acetyltransferase [Myxococcales bacterium]
MRPVHQSVSSFETKRLCAEPLAAHHLAALRAKLYEDPRVMATLGGRVLSEVETGAMLARGLEHWERHGFGTYVFFAREDGRFVGRGGLHRYLLEGEEEVGLLYHLAAAEWGRGLASKIAEACLRVGFEVLGLRSIMSWTQPQNGASRRVMEKCGLSFEREGEFAGLPHLFFRISEPQWRARFSPSAAEQSRDVPRR